VTGCDLKNGAVDGTVIKRGAGRVKRRRGDGISLLPQRKRQAADRHKSNGQSQDKGKPPMNLQNPEHECC
jgi:hypothetical protein